MLLESYHQNSQAVLGATGMNGLMLRLIPPVVLVQNNAVIWEFNGYCP